MYLPKDPYKGLTPSEALKRTGRKNNNCLQDVSDLIGFLGGPDNIETILNFVVDKKENRPDGNSSGLVFTEYEVKVKDMEKTLFKAENTDFRGFGGVIFVELTSQGRIVISATEIVNKIMSDGLDYHTGEPEEALEVEKI